MKPLESTYAQMLACFQGLRRPLPHELVLNGSSLSLLLQSQHVRDNPQSLTGGGGGGGCEAKELRGGRDQLKMERRKGREGVDYLAGDRWEAAKGDAARGGGGGRKEDVKSKGVLTGEMIERLMQSLAGSVR
jgi:hypothetical protein